MCVTGVVSDVLGSTSVSSKPEIVIMKKLLLVLLVGVMATGALSASEQATASEEGTLPESWEQYVRHVTGGNDLGTWVTTGKTEGIFEGIPAGLDFTFVLEPRLGDEGNTIVENHTWRTSDGRVLSTGTGVIYWDEESGTLKSSYSGFDMGEPYTGEMTLLGINFANGTERWKYLETTRGKTTEYTRIHERISANHRTLEFRKADGTGANQFEFKRANPLEGVLARHDILGTWESTRPDGSRGVTTHGRSLAGRAVFSSVKNLKADGSEGYVGSRAMWWDAERKTVRILGLNSRGGSFAGEMISLTTEGDSTTMVVRFRGTNENGVPMAGTSTRVLTGDTMVRTFSDFSRGDRPAAASQPSRSWTIKRTNRD